MIDPPGGWRYGFPKPLPKDVQRNNNTLEWLVKEGYPQEEIDKCGDHFYLRYWEADVVDNI